MKRYRVACLTVAFSVIFLMARCTTGATFIDATGGPAPTGIYSFGEPTTATMGQVFIVPLNDNVLTQFTFYVDDSVANGHDFAEFQTFVYAWNNVDARITGAALYTSTPAASTNNGGLNGPETFTFDIGGLSLTPGGQYIFFASAINQFDGMESFSTTFGQTNNPYPGGAFYYSNVQTFHLLPLTGWDTFAGHDWEFKATFVPEPSVIASLPIIACSWCLIARRRARRSSITKSWNEGR